MLIQQAFLLDPRVAYLARSASASDRVCLQLHHAEFGEPSFPESLDRINVAG
jgi:hypothetical protein